MTVVCAWCGQVIAVGGEMVSHGICPGCTRRFESGAVLKLGHGARPARPYRRRIRSRASQPLPGFAIELGSARNQPVVRARTRSRSASRA